MTVNMSLNFSTIADILRGVENTETWNDEKDEDDQKAMDLVITFLENFHYSKEKVEIDLK
jgi:hypothetical protein